MLFAIFAFVFIFCSFTPASPMAKLVCAIVGLILIVFFAVIPTAYAGSPLINHTPTHFNWKL